jgi:hypothetical protein
LGVLVEDGGVQLTNIENMNGNDVRMDLFFLVTAEDENKPK